MGQYVIIPGEFVLSMAGRVKGNVEFAARQTTDGRWACAAQSVEDFKEEFSALGQLEIVELEASDFPDISIQPQ